MPESDPDGANSSRARWRHRRITATILIVGIALGLWIWYVKKATDVATSPDVTDQDPRLTTATPYQNVRPDVAYVGDSVCAGCHQSIAATFKQHPMGRSMARVTAVATENDRGLENAEPIPSAFDRFGFRFSVERLDSRILHEVALRDAAGKDVLSQKRSVHYVVGSGRRGRAYLVEEDGRLYQSPINWFPQTRQWDLAPNVTKGWQSDFFQPITRQCVFCHAGHAEPMESTINRYGTSVFHDNPAIGCERCHGPGELHVLAQSLGPALSPDKTIVNPSRLAPALREAVCQQCHLQGEIRIERAGRKTFDYRPGLPLEAFWAVFLRTPAPMAQQFVGQVEQMITSRCYRGSNAALGCISCHDPHVLPEPAQRVAYYRARCHACHQQLDCRLVAGERQTKNGDNCIACHMPRISAPDVPHTAVTDHRVLRQAGQATVSKSDERPPLIAGLGLASFFGDAAVDGSLWRDLGVALVEARVPPADRPRMAQYALPLLDTAPANDVRAHLAKAEAQLLMGRAEQALLSFDAVLQLAPDHEKALRGAAIAAEAAGSLQAALDYWHRSMSQNSASAEDHFWLARFFSRQGEWRQALEESKTAVQLGPTHMEARMLLVRSAMQTGDIKLARQELVTVLAFDPPQKEELRRILSELNSRN
jgi:hypothetical protein